MNSSPVSPNRPGRPRIIGDSAGSPRSGREQILEAAAALFVELGFSGTSTRAIAERVGIRQQSLYYHFAGKDEILVELLSNSVRPSNEFVRSIESQVPHDASAAGALYALASFDARTLRRTPHNIGVLYLQPELQDQRFDAFRQDRTQLRMAYGRLGAAAAHPDVLESLDESRLGTLLIQLAEVVIQLRRDGEPEKQDDATIADSCLRLVGLTTPEIRTARAEALELVAQLAGDEPALAASAR
jgi:AcrR family transcriptional regulator